MTWTSYWGIARRRWPIIVVLFVLVAAASGYLYRKASRSAGSQACTTLYVSDVTAPSLTVGAAGSVETLLAGETAANFFADDLLDVAQSRRVAQYVSARLRPAHLPSTSTGDIAGAVSGSRKDRTVNLCVTNPNAESALQIGRTLGLTMQNHRGLFIGPKLAGDTFVRVVSEATVGPAPTSRALLNLLLRLFLGALVALGAAFIWEALDPTVRDQRDIVASLDAPVLTRMRAVLSVLLFFCGMAPQRSLARSMLTGTNSGYWHTSDVRILDAAGQPVHIAGVTWYGMESSLWVPAGLNFQRYTTIMDTVRLLGYNTIRLPLSDELIVRNPIVRHGVDANPGFRGKRALVVLDRIVDYAHRIGLKIISALKKQVDIASLTVEKPQIYVTVAPDGSTVLA